MLQIGNVPIIARTKTIQTTHRYISVLKKTVCGLHVARRKNVPISEEERKQRRRDAQQRYRETHPEQIRKDKENHARYMKTYYKKHIERIRENARKRHKETYIPKQRHNQYREETCDILTEHHEELKDDPDRLSTEFIIGLVEKKNER